MRDKKWKNSPYRVLSLEPFKALAFQYWHAMGPPNRSHKKSLFLVLAKLILTQHSKYWKHISYIFFKGLVHNSNLIKNCKYHTQYSHCKITFWGRFNNNSTKSNKFQHTKLDLKKINLLALYIGSHLIVLKQRSQMQLMNKLT